MVGCTCFCFLVSLLGGRLSIVIVACVTINLCTFLATQPLAWGLIDEALVMLQSDHAGEVATPMPGLWGGFLSKHETEGSTVSIVLSTGQLD